ncbi:protein of unknown function DUF788, TMEM208 [Kipferlia bialata]|uniref:Uncharacterized protein n=1 Tax=Kipferlia bialata TaxID=797122 RepID=A0A9K3CNK0_9EUKA|nr:protein of unknown function DUF788, TMEM208 [Kipferlia bialata]|eukprot:g1299.t1
MAGASAKKLLESNSALLRFLSIYSGVCTGIYVVLTLLLRRDDLKLVSRCVVLGIHLFLVRALYRFLNKICRPEYDQRGRLVNVPCDLKTTKVTSPAVDCILLCMFAFCLSPISTWFFLLDLLIPLYGIYYLVNTVLPMLKGVRERNKPQEVDEALEAKRERRRQRRRKSVSI